MERASFLIEGGSARGRRIDCLFNPDHVVLERISGVRPRKLAGGRISGRSELEDPLLFTGGGETRLTLRLLFDTTLLPTVEPLSRGRLRRERRSRLDVRRLTQPLWELAEGAADDVGGDRELPRGRFLWGKAWNIPVAVMALAERLDFFESDGTPLRSWIHIRLRRLGERTISMPWPDEATLKVARKRVNALADSLDKSKTGYTPGVATVRHVVQPEDRLSLLAARYYGAPWLWRVIALVNDIDTPWKLKVGSTLLIPAKEELPAIRGGQE